MECVREGHLLATDSTLRHGLRRSRLDVTYISGTDKLVRQRVLNRIDFSNSLGAQSGQSNSQGSRQINPIVSSRFVPEF